MIHPGHLEYECAVAPDDLSHFSHDRVMAATALDRHTDTPDHVTDRTERSH